MSSRGQSQPTPSRSPFEAPRDGRPTMRMFQELTNRVDTLTDQNERVIGALERLVEKTDAVDAQFRARRQNGGGESSDDDDADGGPLSATAGPPAPPKPRKHKFSKLRKTFRRLVQTKMGDPKKKPYLYDWPSESRWPTRLLPPTVPGQHRRRELLLRLNFDKPYKWGENQNQLRPIFDYMRRYKRKCGVPASMSRERLVTVCARTFAAWKSHHKLLEAQDGRDKLDQERARSRLHGSKRAKRWARSEALGVKTTVRFANGDEVADIAANVSELARRATEMRADIEFAVLRQAHSPDVFEKEPLPNGQERKVVRPLFLEWRSKELLRVLAFLDSCAPKTRVAPVRPCRERLALPPNFRLPSSVRRWMVSSAFQEAHRDACLDVSDNAGPFRDSSCSFAVSRGARAWGRPVTPERVPADVREATFVDAAVGEETNAPADYFSIPLDSDEDEDPSLSDTDLNGDQSQPDHRLQDFLDVDDEDDDPMGDSDGDDDRSAGSQGFASEDQEFDSDDGAVGFSGDDDDEVVNAGRI